MHFINSDLSRREGVNTFIKDILDYYESIGGKYIYDREEAYADRMKEKAVPIVEELKKFQKKINPFVKYIFNPNSDFRDKRHYRFLISYVLPKAEKIMGGQDIHHISLYDGRWRQNIHYISLYGRYLAFYWFVCHALMVLTEDKFDYFETRLCRECNEPFSPKTLREQSFCSNRCRFKYHNADRIKSGKHARYVKQWREKKKESK